MTDPHVVSDGANVTPTDTAQARVEAPPSPTLHGQGTAPDGNGAADELNGEALALVERMDVRFWPRVLKTDTCWLWQGGKKAGGYGSIRLYSTMKTYSCHRLAYRVLRGPVPKHLVLDHLCRVTSCVNPYHLEIVTLVENLRRGAVPMGTHCRHGHPRTPENMAHFTSGGRVFPRCRPCRSEREKAARRKRKDSK